MDYIKQLEDITNTDRNNCALNAMAIVFNLPYYEVYSKFKQFGRVGGKGSSLMTVTAVLNCFSWYRDSDVPISKWIKTKGKNPTKLKMTLDKFAKQYPKGKYYVVKHNHALALIDGVWYDNQVPNPRSYVKYFFKVE